MTTVIPNTGLSPIEVVMQMLKDGAPTLEVVVGPATDEQQQAGVVSLVQAGLPVVEKYAPILWCRAQMRCLDATLAGADRIAWMVQGAMHSKVRTQVVQPSTGETYLVHLCSVTGGPSMHYDSPETWETLMFAEVMMGTVPTLTP